MSSSTSSTASSSAMAAEEEEDDRMMTEEFEAAEALADLAKLAMWSGDTRGRTNKRVKSESPPNLSESVTRRLDLPQEVIENPRLAGTAEPSSMAEPDLKAPSTSLIGSSGTTSFGCGKSRRNLTETEKEERRMRRILANRESARQTIRRRQAVCEELTKKAANLVLENARLKREVETAASEYRVLEKTNKDLKDQVSMVEISEAAEEESRGNPMLYYNPPLFWSAIPSQYQNPVDHHHHYFPVPYPWFFPVQSQPSISDREAGPSSRATMQTHAFLPVKEKSEPSTSEAKITDDLNEEPSSSNVKMTEERALTSDSSTILGLDSCGEALSRKSTETAEARKRRKELRKLKNLHGRHSRMD